ncbi:uncharacterized protein LOC130934047 [Arachis stenosperma]|uniref:uncharacterized protein LOC130934047 n=1 Tax=Arachis stenosperma TaxID=217475 RepID=UPI0025AD4596|nr:uncharacterized protein LOC130934047 [Arachis stenosperma]
MPLYAKFLKEIINKKRHWDEKERVILTQEYSVVIQKGLPPKLKDPGSFFLSCTTGSILLDKALCDQGASINLMPLSLMKQLAIEELKPTRMSLQMADRSLKIPNGVVENLLMKVGEFIFPANFVILDMEEEGHDSIILGTPFLATARAIIDVEKGEMILRVHDEQMSINVFKAMEYPLEKAQHMKVEMIEELMEEVFEVNGQEEQEEETEVVQEVSEEQVTEIPSKGEIKEKPKQDLKPLPPHLKYVFLGKEDSFPVIINSALSGEEESKLLVVLKDYKDALGWTIDDLKEEALRQREAEKDLQMEIRRSQELEDKLLKLEADLKTKANQSPHVDSSCKDQDSFTKEIMKTKIPKDFKLLDMTLYDDTTDPSHHLSNFRSKM